jgi:hypothetical protein
MGKGLDAMMMCRETLAWCLDCQEQPFSRTSYSCPFLLLVLAQNFKGELIAIPVCRRVVVGPCWICFAMIAMIVVLVLGIGWYERSTVAVSTVKPLR